MTSLLDIGCAVLVLGLCIVILTTRIVRAIVSSTKNTTNYERYQHHGKFVWVRSDLKGTHRDSCLCYVCNKFQPGSEANCPKAKALYDLVVKNDMVTPVYECPSFGLDRLAHCRVWNK